MLYDPKWEVKADPLSLDSLIIWLENQPAGTKYNFTEPTKCLLAQFLQYQGQKNYCLGAGAADAFFGGHGARILRDEPRTFGAALDRARAAQVLAEEACGK